MKRIAPIRSGQVTFTAPNGQIVSRPRGGAYLTSDAELRRIDLDAMDREKLYAFMAKRKQEYDIDWARRLFPMRPVHYPRTAKLLYRMAWMKIHGHKKAYERMYLQLPPYAQFRRSFNVQACIVANTD